MKKQYLKLTLLSGELVPQEDNLSPEQKHEREVQRIINGDEPEQGLPIYTFGNFREECLFLPVSQIEDFFSSTNGTVVLVDGGQYLVKETPQELFGMLDAAGVAELIN